MKKDIYYNVYYGKLYENIEHGKLETFEVNSEYGKIEHIFIKREIEMNTEGKYYDIVTPYGYGGPIITECNDREKLLAQFEKNFTEYCTENNIVSEFIRFHPIFENALDFKGIYDVVYSRHTVGTNLKDYDDPVQAEFSKSLRREIRKAEKNGVTVRTILEPKDLSVFKKLYEETMDRNEADAYYYFPDSYYEYIIKYLGKSVLEIQLIYENEIIASEMYFIEGDLMHAHLLGSSQKMLDLDAGALLEATAARWGHEHGYRYIHHGGGRTSAEDDSLYTYKKKYGKNTEFDFYVGKKIWDREKYDELVAKREGELNHKIDSDYFPKYRA
ncbi:peptidoglycan bridge formation glycyltransferase FemA/FemB family protein [Absicoccus porci]|uniref:Peptidoglycan bridge formation glycyltransferase FemA/FemB family protein n=1 Tax=Absicoccus porci TaxID=2486576 RepID=A0A3N0I3W9_9FIRM|nr:peptidoglycan bridge formation glycyltransferase FemA/FemB family protein [Absicoccus porci]RNM31022.1 peptidoglycan bridge formation glycyltransferase FemA/FemB family protein [Absicoccus porci]